MSPNLPAAIALGLVIAGLVALALWTARSARKLQLAQPAVPPGVLRAHAAPAALPAFRFQDGAGQPRTLADFRGRYVLLNVWATWCAPCRKEMPTLARLQARLGGPDFEVLALSIDAGGAQAGTRFYREIGVEGLAVYVDAWLQVYSALGVVGVPTTMLLDRDGRELARHVGAAQWDGEPAVQSIQRFMAP